MNFQLNQIVIEIATEKRCIIVASNENPWKKNRDMYNKTEKFPEDGCDYIILVEIKPNEYKGEKHVTKDQIKSIS